MALIFKCDKCGKQYEPYDVFDGEYVIGTNGITQTTIELEEGANDIMRFDKRNYIFCEECCKSFNRWLRDKDNRKD